MPRARSRPRPRSRCPTTRAIVGGRSRTGATTSSPCSSSARGAACSGSGPAYVYGSTFATSAKAALPTPRTSSAGSRRPRRSSSVRATRRAKARSPGRRPSRLRPSASTRRTTSASKPTPQLNPNRRPFIRPSEMRRVLPAARASPRRRAASTGSRGRPSTRDRTLVPPPGRNPSGTRPSAPFSASLKPPSPEKTKIASASVTASTSSTAWPGRSVKSVSTLAPRSSSARTASTRCSVTWLANGLTTSTARLILAEHVKDRPRRRRGIRSGRDGGVTRLDQIDDPGCAPTPKGIGCKSIGPLREALFVGVEEHAWNASNASAPGCDQTVVAVAYDEPRTESQHREVVRAWLEPKDDLDRPRRIGLPRFDLRHCEIGALGDERDRGAARSLDPCVDGASARKQHAQQAVLTHASGQRRHASELDERLRGGE